MVDKLLSGMAFAVVVAALLWALWASGFYVHVTSTTPMKPCPSRLRTRHDELLTILRSRIALQITIRFASFLRLSAVSR